MKNKIAEIIRNKRKELNFTQAELSEAVSIRQALLSNIENGKGNYTINSLIIVCEYLNLKIL